MKKRKEKNNGSFLSSLLLYKNKRLRVLNNRIEEKREIWDFHIRQPTDAVSDNFDNWPSWDENDKPVVKVVGLYVFF